MSRAVSFPSQVSIQSLPPESILAAALDEYKKNTGNDLQSHPLSAELQCCDSVDGIMAILQRQADSVEKLRDGNRGIMKWVRSSVIILCSISSKLGDGAGLVRPRKPTCGTYTHSDINARSSHMRNRSLLASAPSLLSVSFRSFSRARFRTEISQAARDVSASHDVLLDLFQRMDDFFKRFKVYSQTFLNTELAEILVKVVVKVLSILSIAMKEVEQSRTSESILCFF